MTPIQSEKHELDESTLANDVVRLLGSENQHLKRELQEAQKQARAAEARAREAEALLVKKEPSESTQELAATEHTQQLIEEHTALKTQNQDLQSKLEEEKAKRKSLKLAHKTTQDLADKCAQQLTEENTVLKMQNQELLSKLETEKEKRKTLKVENKELKSGASRGKIDESPEFLALQERQKQTSARLVESENKTGQLSQQIEYMMKEKETDKRLLVDATDKIASFSRNSPWKYISELFEQCGDFGFTRVNAFKADDQRSRARFKVFYKDTLLPQGLARFPFVYRHDITWRINSPGFGITISPSYRHVPNKSKPGHHWCVGGARPIEGNFELLYKSHGLWYYCGTYTTTIIETRNNSNFYTSLRQRVKEQLMNETIDNPELLAPIVRNSIEELYSSGVLHINCLVYERIGFNKDLYTALLDFDKSVSASAYVLNLTDPDKKRRVEHQSIPTGPKAKRIRMDAAQTRSSKLSNRANS